MRKNNFRITLGMDRNGNKTLLYKPAGERGFSVQTNGNLPLAHWVSGDKAEDAQQALLSELKIHVFKFGTPRQKNLMPLR